MAWPFLSFDADAYIGRTFQFSRRFLFKWSVNWQFLGEEIMTGEVLPTLLLGAHLTLLVVFLFGKWVPLRLRSFFSDFRLDSLEVREVNPRFIAGCLFTCNVIGVLCARSLHF